MSIGDTAADEAAKAVVEVDDDLRINWKTICTEIALRRIPFSVLEFEDGKTARRKLGNARMALKSQGGAFEAMRDGQRVFVAPRGTLPQNQPTRAARALWSMRALGEAYRVYDRFEHGSAVTVKASVAKSASEEEPGDARVFTRGGRLIVVDVTRARHCASPEELVAAAVEADGDGRPSAGCLVLAHGDVVRARMKAARAADRAFGAGKVEAAVADGILCVVPLAPTYEWS